MCAKSSQSRLTLLRPHGLQPARLLCPWVSPGKKTGAGCHALLQGDLPDPEIDPWPMDLKLFIAVQGEIQIFLAPD